MASPAQRSVQAGAQEANSYHLLALVFIKVIALVVFGALFFGLRSLINWLYTKKHGTPHPALAKMWAL